MKLGRLSFGLLCLVTSFGNVWATNYECFVSEETATESKPVGSMKVDTATTEVSFVAIDQYLFSACKGAKIGEASSQISLLICAFIVDNPADSTKGALNAFAGLSSISNDTQETRSLTGVPEQAGLLIHIYKRNARTFQVGCQIPAAKTLFGQP